jgi:hypothetical protein
VSNRNRPSSDRIVRSLFLSQGLYYILTGLWPLVSMTSFEAVTGPKTDHWLVQMIGLLAASIGASLVTAAGQPESFHVSVSILLAASSALSFSAIDVIYASNGTILPIYLADAAAEITLLAVLGIAYWRLRSQAAAWPNPIFVYRKGENNGQDKTTHSQVVRK